MTETEKLQLQTRRTRWGVNRLVSLQSLFCRSAPAISPSPPSPTVEEVHVTSFPVKERWFPVYSEKFTAEEQEEKQAAWNRLKEHERTTLDFPEDGQWALLAKYDNLPRNEFLHRKHVVQEQVYICDCRPETKCGQSCINTALSVECTPNNCPCGSLCQNQKFQKCEYARVQKGKTNNRGWGLFANEDIKESDFVIEYCGEVISDTVAKSRLRAYEAAGMKETYMMYLDGTESLDATRKGNLARFINHSCEPNCRLKKWYVLGELCIGVFAEKDVKSGEELSYDYNIQLQERTKIKCLCGSSSCVGFLGIKPQASQEVETEDTSTEEAVEAEDNQSRGNVINVGLDIFAESNRGDLSSQELLTQLYLVAIGVCNNYGMPAKPKRQRQETSAGVGAPLTPKRRRSSEGPGASNGSDEKELELPPRRRRSSQGSGASAGSDDVKLELSPKHRRSSQDSGVSAGSDDVTFESPPRRRRSRQASRVSAASAEKCENGAKMLDSLSS